MLITLGSCGENTFGETRTLISRGKSPLLYPIELRRRVAPEGAGVLEVGP